MSLAMGQRLVCTQSGSSWNDSGRRCRLQLLDCHQVPLPVVGPAMRLENSHLNRLMSRPAAQVRLTPLVTK